MSLRPPAPPDYFEKNIKGQYSKLLHKQFAIVVQDTLYPLSNWASSLRIYCKGSSFNDGPSHVELKELVCKRIEESTAPQKFKVKHLKNIGRYFLISEESKSDLPIVGKVQFSQVVFDKKNSLAAFVAVISDGGKLFIEKFFILSKEMGKWKVIKTEIFSIS